MAIAPMSADQSAAAWAGEAAGAAEAYVDCAGGRRRGPPGRGGEAAGPAPQSACCIGLGPRPYAWSGTSPRSRVTMVARHRDASCVRRTRWNESVSPETVTLSLHTVDRVTGAMPTLANLDETNVIAAQANTEKEAARTVQAVIATAEHLQRFSKAEVEKLLGVTLTAV